MKNIVFDSAHEKIFSQNGLKEFDDFIDFSRGQIIHRNKKRNVSIMRLPSHEGERVYFMKRFFSPHFKDMLFTVRNFGRLCSQAELEIRNARILLDSDIETYHPVCWGAKTFCGIEKRSFFITERIHGRSLIDFLFDHWKAFDMVQRKTLMVELAKFFKKLHQAKLSLTDAYLKHLFLVEPINHRPPYHFAIIDLHRMQINVTALRHAACNLAAFLFSLPDEWFDIHLRDLFLHTYLELSDTNPIMNSKAFLKTVKKREHTLMSRRKKISIEHLKTMV